MSKRSERIILHCAFRKAVESAPPANAVHRCEVTA